MVAGKKRAKAKDCKMNSIVAGIDLGDRESLATVLSPVGDVALGGHRSSGAHS
jgi:hypothetical protein